MSTHDEVERYCGESVHWMEVAWQLAACISLHCDPEAVIKTLEDWEFEAKYRRRPGTEVRVFQTAMRLLKSIPRRYSVSGARKEFADACAS
jgi:hypothetical protein